MVPPDLLEELLQAALSIDVLEDVAGKGARHELDGRGVQRALHLDALSGAAFDRLQHVQRRGPQGERPASGGVPRGDRVGLPCPAENWEEHVARAPVRGGSLVPPWAGAAFCTKPPAS